jgi:hypothetical protein
MASCVVLIDDARERGRRRRRRRVVHRPGGGGRVRARTQRGDSARALTRAEVWIRWQQQFGVDQDVALGDFAVRIRQELDVPLAVCVLDWRASLAEEAPRISLQGGPAVESVQLLGKGSNRLLLQNWRDPLQPGELVRVKVDEVAAGRERGVLERLEVLPHVVEHRLDQIAGGSSALVV